MNFLGDKFATIQQHKNSCLKEAATKTQRPKMCKDITYIPFRDDCYYSIGIKQKIRVYAVTFKIQMTVKDV